MRRLHQEYTGPRHGSTSCTPTWRRQSQRHPEFEVSLCYKERQYVQRRRRRQRGSHRHVKKCNQI